MELHHLNDAGFLARTRRTRPKSAISNRRSVPDLLAWASWVMAKSEQSPALHHCLLLNQLTSVCRGEIDRLMVLMPPGSAKSTYASLLFPAWWFTQHPDSSVIATSHTTSLAEQFGRQVRELVEEYGDQLGYGLHASRKAAGQWQTTAKGEYFATGIRGPLTGRRADLVIIDDPVKSHAEADSPVLARSGVELVPLRSDHSAQATRSDRADHDALA